MILEDKTGKTGFINSHGITKTGFILMEDKTDFIISGINLLYSNLTSFILSLFTGFIPR